MVEEDTDHLPPHVHTCAHIGIHMYTHTTQLQTNRAVKMTQEVKAIASSHLKNSGTHEEEGES